MAKILIIDDSESVLMMTADYLQEDGHTTVACLSPTEALRKAAGTKFDLIITDIYMPDKDGLDVLREARANHPGVPVIAMSSADGARDMSRVAKNLGAVFMLKKPFTTEELLYAVDSALITSTSAVR